MRRLLTALIYASTVIIILTFNNYYSTPANAEAPRALEEPRVKTDKRKCGLTDGQLNAWKNADELWSELNLTYHGHPDADKNHPVFVSCRIDSKQIGHITIIQHSTNDVDLAVIQVIKRAAQKVEQQSMQASGHHNGSIEAIFRFTNSVMLMWPAKNCLTDFGIDSDARRRCYIADLRFQLEAKYRGHPDAGKQPVVASCTIDKGQISEVAFLQHSSAAADAAVRKAFDVVAPLMESESWLLFDQVSPFKVEIQFRDLPRLLSSDK